MSSELLTPNFWSINQVNYEKNKGRVVIGDITVTCAK